MYALNGIAYVISKPKTAAGRKQEIGLQNDQLL